MVLFLFDYFLQLQRDPGAGQDQYGRLFLVFQDAAAAGNGDYWSNANNNNCRSN